VAGHEGPSGEIKSKSTEFKSTNGEPGSCGVGSFEAESELHDTATMFCHFLSGIVMSVCKR
jgi:hypothetical protein